MKTHTTNYFNTLITVAEDTKAERGTIPPEKDGKKSIANYQFEMLTKNSNQYTSDELLFEIFAIRNDISDNEKEEAKKLFFSKGQPCMRTSPLTKTYGWGILFDGNGKMQLIDSISEIYEELVNNKAIKKVAAMKSKK